MKIDDSNIWDFTNASPLRVVEIIVLAIRGLLSLSGYMWNIED